MGIAVSLRGALLQLLADGRFHSGASLGGQLGVSRSAIWKHIRFLQAHQIDIHAVQGRGYRLAVPVELLSQAELAANMDQQIYERLGAINILYETDSTNRLLMSRIGRGASAGDVCLAEYQSAGRGRQGRSWVSPFAANIYMSLLWHFPTGAEGLTGLGLVIGVCVLEACHALGADSVKLKWPNDLVHQGRKLAGVLLELRSSPAGGCYVVIGIGLNVRMSGNEAAKIDQPWTDLEQLLSRHLSRNRVLALLLAQLIPGLDRFQQESLAPFIERWRSCDALKNCPVSLHSSMGVVEGVARGVDNYGAILIEQNGQVKSYLVGDVSLRASR
jgi:BirA family biotin operon repressor/biotin-[acetyl-CoA-carboxylase] ligase